MSKVTMIKKDAVVSIRISAAFLQRLQKLMVAIALERSPEEMQSFKEQAEKIRSEQNYAPQFTEDWMDDIFTLSILINEIEGTLIKEGFTYEQDVEDATPQENSPLDQSQSQPE